MKVTDNINYAEKNLDRLLAWIGRHDARTNFVFGINTALAGFLFNVSPSFKYWSNATFIVVAITAIFLLCSFVHIIRGFAPKVSPPKDSLIFFQAISLKTETRFRKECKKQQYEEYLDDLLSQCHINSLILARKFFHLKNSLRCTTLSIPFWLSSIFLLSTTNETG